MSSILEALKKAERESAADRGRATPWSAPLPEPSPYRPRRRLWWLPVSAALVAAVCAVVFWQVRSADSPQPAPSMPASSPRSSGDRASSPAANSPAASQQTASMPVSVGSASQRPPVRSDSSKPTAADPVAAKKAIQRTPTPAPPAAQQLPRPKPRPQPATATPPPTAAAEAPLRQPAPPPKKVEKSYRSDPRIELQALVWAPQAADRFVVINNRLIKEGGSIDTITVVEILRDDVLLSEGADRWYEKFKIR